MNKFCLLVLMYCPVMQVFCQQTFSFTSPDKKIAVDIKLENQLHYSIFHNQKPVLQNATAAMVLSGGVVLGKDIVVLKTSTRQVNQTTAPLYGINKIIKEQYNELTVECKGNYSLEFRAYNEGFAYRFITTFSHGIIIQNEQAHFHFTGNYTAYFHPRISEANYRIQKIAENITPNYSSLPLLIKTDDGVNVLIHESDVLSYPCMALASDSSKANTLSAVFAKYPLAAEPGGHSNFNLIVKQTGNYIANTAGKRSFPWRIVAFEENDIDILNNEIVYLLASENKLKETKWIKPGKVAWDWWNALNLKGVPFKTGYNTETYKYFIDFAAANGIEYINLDEGWSDQFDLMKVTEKIDMRELVQYAKQKKVGIFLWCVWHVMDRQMIEALDQFKKWNIAGVKVDFMDRDDQVVVEFQERLLKEAARRNILVNYHGAYHPNGMNRTYPNQINAEGVRGLEWNKFDAAGTSPNHDVTIPFIRMFAGSMDYTPGAMNNYNKTDWRSIMERPMAQGTLCHQLAMYTVYYGALQMLADAPTAYTEYADVLKYISAVPSVWDETKPLDGSVGRYVAVARKKNDQWFVGAMTNWDARTITLSVDFLDADKTYTLQYFEDGLNAHRIGNDYSKKIQTVKKGDKIKITMAPGGGWAGIISVNKAKI